MPRLDRVGCNLSGHKAPPTLEPLRNPTRPEDGFLLSETAFAHPSSTAPVCASNTVVLRGGRVTDSVFPPGRRSVREPPASV